MVIIQKEQSHQIIFWLRNKDGSWSLYDNDRFEDYTPFHEQLFAINWSGFKLEDDKFGGTVSFTLITGGWEWEHLDLSLLDFGHAELSYEIGANGVSVSAFASIYSPSVSFDLFGIKIQISFEIGAVGFDFKYNPEEKYFKSKLAGGLGFGITIDW